MFLKNNIVVSTFSVAYCDLNCENFKLSVSRYIKDQFTAIFLG